MALDSAGTHFRAPAWYLGSLHLYSNLWAHIVATGSFEAGCSYRSSLHASEREARHPTIAVRTDSVQTSMSSSPQSVCVRHLHPGMESSRLTSLELSILERACGFARFVCHVTHSLLTIKISLRTTYLQSFILRAQQLSINSHDRRLRPRSSSTSWTPARRKIA